jgi:hypothetical protein
MNPAINKLLSIAGPAITAPDEPDHFLNRWGRLGLELAETLRLRNGFYAYESALLLRPYRHRDAPLGLLEWNAPSLWKGEYTGGLPEILFFAEDAFGEQFCIRGDWICSFKPEEGSFVALAASLGEWAAKIGADRDFLTGYPLAHSWQVAIRPILPGERLLPTVPFVLGGKFELQNLHAGEDIEGMRFRALIASQIRDMPDGSQIVLEVTEENGTEPAL